MKLIICLIVLVLASVYFTNEATKRSEIAECEAWRKEAREYPDWKSTRWQRMQCEHYKLELP